MSRVRVYHENQASKGGIGFTNALQITFIVLKLCKVIDWSWWLVLAPTWISLCLAVLIIAVAFIIAEVKDE